MNKKLRLLLFENCNRSCPGCCNNDWDLSKLPIVESFDDYDEILLTGGEPMLMPMTVINTAAKIRRSDVLTDIYMYTAKVNNLIDMIAVLSILDGITVTLHEQKDVAPFLLLNRYLCSRVYYYSHLSLRLNVFEGIQLKKEQFDCNFWKVKWGMEWIKNCPIPIDEVFKRAYPQQCI